MGIILKEEDLHVSCHGVVYLDLQPLLYPGATHIRGAYRIVPFVDSEFANKVNSYIITIKLVLISFFICITIRKLAKTFFTT